MHNSVRWTTEEQNSLLYTMRGPWNWEAVNEMLIIGDELMGSVDHPVDVNVIYNSCPCPATSFTGGLPPTDMTGTYLGSGTVD